MSRFENLVNAHLGARQAKEARLQDLAREKQEFLDPSYKVNVNDLSIVDADTVDLPTGERLRLGGGEGRTLDSYETDPAYYINSPQKEAQHRRSYAEAFGLDPDDVTREDLVRAGESQRAKFRERLLGAADSEGNLSYRGRGQDRMGRTLAEFDNLDLSGRDDNAAYESKFNWEQRLRDIASGEQAEHQLGEAGRSWRQVGTDQVVNFATGAGRMANDLIQGAGTLVGVNNIPGIDEGHHAVREGLEAFKEWGGSNTLTRRERLAGKRRELESEFYANQKQKYIEAGNSETFAAIRAGYDEFSNAVGNIIENPGNILDKTIESLPYMLGVAGTARTATTLAVKQLQKNVLKNAGVQKNISRGLKKYGIEGTKGKFQKAAANEASAAFHTQRFISSAAGQKYLRGVGTKAGIGTVGLTEGLSTSAEVYDSVINMTEEQAMNSDQYVLMRENGKTHEEALEELAEKAHLQTLISVTLAAGAASFITGAGAFEGNLFRSLAGVRKGTVDKLAKGAAAKKAEDVATKPAKKSITRRVVGGTAKGVGVVGKHLGPASAKEGAEEFLQSGGGELLSQLAKSSVTGEEVGAGVGAAAGEGLVIGAASGGIAQGFFGTLQKVGSVDMKKAAAMASAYKDRNKPQPINATPAPSSDGGSAETATPEPAGGSIEEQIPTIKEDGAAAFEAAASVLDTAEKVEPRVTTFLKLEAAKLTLEAQGKELDDGQQAVYNAVKGAAMQDVAAAANESLDKKPEDRNYNDLSRIALAGEMGVVLDTNKMSEEEARVYEGTIKLAEAFEEVAQGHNEQLRRATSDAQRKTIAKVYDQKFGDGKSVINGVERPGLRYYARRMRELMNMTNFGERNPEMESLISGLKNFTASQNTYLDNLRTVVREKRNIGNIKWVAPAAGNSGGTPALLEILEREDRQFKEIRQGLINRYNDWKAAGTPTVRGVAGEAKEATEAADAAKERDAAAKKEASAKPKLDRKLRDSIKELRENTEIGTDERRKGILQLMKRARRSADKGPLKELKKLNERNNIELKKIQKTPKAPVTEQPDDGLPQFSEEVEADNSTAGQSKTIREAVKGGTRSALEFIRDNSKSKVANILAARLIQDIGDRDVQLLEMNQEEFTERTGSETAKAAYIRNKSGKGPGLIILNTSKLTNSAGYVQAILHEALHAAIDGHIDEGIDPKLKKRLTNLNLRVVRALSQTDDPRAQTMARILARDAEELLTHGITTPYLQNFLKDMKIGNRTAWDQFVQFVSEILGISQDSGLAEVLDITDAILQDKTGQTADEIIKEAREFDNRNRVDIAGIVDEGDTEGAGPIASAIGNATETAPSSLGQVQAVTPGQVTDEELKAKAELEKKAMRLSEARRLRTLFGNNQITAAEAFLSEEQDRQLLTRLINSGVDPVLAVEQVLAAIEPNPQARNITADPKVPVELINEAATKAAQLNTKGAKPVKARTGWLGQLTNLIDVVTGSPANLRAELDKRKLAPSASEMWKTRSDSVNDLLAADENIMEILSDPVAREMFFEQAGTTPSEERALRAFASFHNDFARVLNESIKNLPGTAIGLANEVDRNPLHYFFQDGKMDPNVSGAMALEAMQHLIGSGAMSTFNTDDDIRGILGLENDFENIPAWYHASLGRGVPRNTVIQELGYRSLSHVNLSNKSERDLLNEITAAAFGAQILTTLKQMYARDADGDIIRDSDNQAITRITQHSVSRALWSQMSRSEDNVLDNLVNEEGSIVMVHNSVGRRFDVPTSNWVEEDVNARLRDVLTEGRDIFNKLFGSSSTVRDPLLREPTIDDIPTHVGRSNSLIPEVMRKRMLHDAKNAWSANPELIDLLSKFETPEQYLEWAHEFATDEDLVRAHETVAPGLEGRNRGLMRDLLEAQRWNHQFKDRDFYLPSKMTRNGRFMIDSNVINPQANKLHRFLFVRDGWKRGITKKAPSAMKRKEYKAYQRLMMAIGLGMGIKTDATPVADVVRQVEEAFTQPGTWQRAMEALRTENDKFDATQLAALKEVLGKEGTHTLAALKAASDWFGAEVGAQVEISLPHETDGVTNGYIIGLLMTPPPKGSHNEATYKQLLNAGGIFFKGDPWKSFAQYKQEGNLDNYQHISQDTRSNLRSLWVSAMNTSEEALTQYKKARKYAERMPGRNIRIQREIATIAQSGLVPTPDQLNVLELDDHDGKVGRNFAKDPLMVMAYGAGFASVGRQVNAQALEKFYELLAEAGNPKDGREPSAAEVAAAMNRAYAIINMVVDANNAANIHKITKDEAGNTIFVPWPYFGTTNNSGRLSASDVQALADSRYGGDLGRLTRQFVLGKEAKELFKTGLDITYGNSLQDALAKRLAPVLEIRQLMNAGNQFANKLYVAYYENVVAEQEAAGAVLRPQDKSAIQANLAQQGLVPSMPTAASNGIEEYLEMTAQGKEILRAGKNTLMQGVGTLENPMQLTGIEYGANNRTRAAQPTSSITGRLYARVPNDDVGVSAVVKAIHALDGVINSLLWGQGPYSVLNVHDAQVSPWWAADTVATNANVAFGEVLASYDLPRQFADMVGRVVYSLYSEQDTRLTPKQKQKIGRELLALYEAPFSPFRNAVPTDLTEEQTMQWAFDNMVNELGTRGQASRETKGELFSEIRVLNQFAQEDTSVFTPQGIDLDNPVAFAGPAPKEASLEEQVVEDLPFDDDVDVKLAEEFENQLESEKVVNVWDGLAQLEQGEIDADHQNHLRGVIETLVAPGLQTIEPIFQEILEAEGGDMVQAAWQGRTLHLATAANTLNSNAPISLQERAAQEYVAALVEYGVSEDHFVRKEARRLFEMADENLTWQDFLPAEITGDPAIAESLAQQRYNSIFNNTDADTALKRFLALGLTNKPFIQALSSIDNPGQPALQVPDWNKGILRGMLSILRQIVQKVSGTGLRSEGGNAHNALTALAQATLYANVRNQQRLQDLRTGADGTSRVQKLNQRIVNAVAERFVDPLADALRESNEKKLDPKNPTIRGFVGAATYSVLRSQDKKTRDAYNTFYRQVTSPYGIGKDNGFFETIAEITPWKDEDLNWVGLLRRSKYMVDMARQEANDHTRSYLMSSFDDKRHMSKAEKIAITNVIMKTDLVALMDGDQSLTVDGLAELLRDSDARRVERLRIESMLRAEIAIQGLDPKLLNLFVNQATSLGHFQVTGEAGLGNPMLNAHNIVQQFNLDRSSRIALKDAAKLENLVDRYASIVALQRTPLNDLRLANQMVEHEMARDVNDNGFSRLLGSHINFQALAKQNLFKDSPVNMIKGYIYEIFDGDVNVEYVERGSDREQELIDEGFIEVGPLDKDSLDNYKGDRVLYKGLKGLNTYNKSVVSLTDLQHRGANLFSTNGYQSQATLRNLGNVRDAQYLAAEQQFDANYSKPGNNMVPVLNQDGDIVDYRYMMSENNKRNILKKEDPFDRVLPKMFASITDRNNTKVINEDVMRLLKLEYDAGKNDPSQRFVMVGRASSDKAGRDMWNLLPEDMQRNAEATFGFPGIYVRDNVANLVLGFRKMSISNIKGPDKKGTLWGKQTPVVRIAEKVWQEIVSLMRIKIAILTPAVVVGNIASNTAMLLSEGIPVNFIRRHAAEAISGMRQYQKDRQKATELMRRIGSDQALGKNTRRLELQLSRLNAELAANPVGQLVEEGLFTSITADLGVDDDTIRGSLIQKAEDALGDKGGKAGKLAAKGIKELYMLPGSKGYQAAVAATQYGDFVGRYVKFMYDTKVNKKDKEQAINDALAAFIYYDIPQPKYLQALNDSGLVMFTKFFLRIQPIVARMYSQNPASAFAVLGLQKGLLPQPFNENIMNYGMGDGLTNKGTNPINLPGKAWNTLDPTEPALLQWILNPFGL